MVIFHVYKYENEDKIVSERVLVFSARSISSLIDKVCENADALGVTHDKEYIKNAVAVLGLYELNSLMKRGSVQESFQSDLPYEDGSRACYRKGA